MYCPGLRKSRSGSQDAHSSAALLLLELPEQRLELIWYGLVHHLGEHAAQPVAEPIGHLLWRTGSRARRRLAWLGFFAHDHGNVFDRHARPGHFGNPPFGAIRTPPELKKFQYFGNLPPLSHIVLPPFFARAMQRP